jgi:hypothetical protein
MGLLSNKISPEVGFSKPEIKFKSVVFPQPEGPVTQTNSPSPISRFMSSKVVLEV